MRDAQTFLQRSGRTEQDLLFQVKLSVLTNALQAKVVQGKANVSQAQIAAYYAKNRQRFAQPESRDLLVVLTKTQAKAQQALTQLQHHKAWKDVVKTFSIDTASKAQGGKLPGVTKGTQEKAFDTYGPPAGVDTVDAVCDQPVLVPPSDAVAEGADPAFELIADHARPATDVPLGYRTSARAVERGKGVLLRNVKPVDVVECAIVRLGHDGERPVERNTLADQPLDDGVAYDADAMRVRDHHRSREKPRLFEPRGARHFAVAIEREPAAEHGVAVGGAAREEGGDARADRALTHDELSLPLDDGAMPHGHARDVGDGVERAGCPVERDAEVASTRASLRLNGRCEDEQRGQYSHLRSPGRKGAVLAACRRRFASAPRGPWRGLSSRHR